MQRDESQWPSLHLARATRSPPVRLAHLVKAGKPPRQRAAEHRRATRDANIIEGGVCFICLATRDLHGHHIQPYARGGAGTHENIVMVCRRCHGVIHHGRDVEIGREIFLAGRRRHAPPPAKRSPKKRRRLPAKRGSRKRRPAPATPRLPGPG
jgi:hypothetical protein